MSKPYQIYGELPHIVLIGLGSIGRAALPLIERHFKFNPKNVSIFDPKGHNFHLFQGKPYKAIKQGITSESLVPLLDPIVKPGTFVVNLSCDVSSAEVIKFCRAKDANYIDTVIEPWLGGYDDHNAPSATRSNYVMREEIQDLKASLAASMDKGATAITCCGANPGMVSWFVKDALLDIARDTGISVPNSGMPETRAEWAALMQTLGVKGIHVAERDTQQTINRLPKDLFVNTWSCDGFIAEGFHQPAELGWGTHEKWMPQLGRRHETGCQAAIYLEQPGAVTQVRSWCPTLGPQKAFLVTHNEAISISDYYTVVGPNGTNTKPQYRPTCHYAYRMCDEAVMCCNDIVSSGIVPPPDKREVINDDNIAPGGFDELGVLVYGHKKNAYWLGSKLSIEQARELAPFQNPTAMQVSSAVVAGMVYAINHPREGILEADEMQHRECLDVQRQYLGDIIGKYTDWTPLQNNFIEDMFKDYRDDKKVDKSDPWQFKNVLVH